MEKAFDLKVLGQKLKAKGLIQAEELAEDIVNETFAWIDQSAQIHSNPLVKTIVPVLAASVKPIALAEVEKISDEV